MCSDFLQIGHLGPVSTSSAQSWALASPPLTRARLRLGLGLVLVCPGMPRCPSGWTGRRWRSFRRRWATQQWGTGRGRRRMRGTMQSSRPRQALGSTTGSRGVRRGPRHSPLERRLSGPARQHAPRGSLGLESTNRVKRLGTRQC